VVTVGAAENARRPSTVAYFSSRGPTLDQRIKPDLVAPGDGVHCTHTQRRAFGLPMGLWLLLLLGRSQLILYQRAMHVYPCCLSPGGGVWSGLVAVARSRRRRRRAPRAKPRAPSPRSAAPRSPRRPWRAPLRCCATRWAAACTLS
jgi:hypothetical protein